MKSYRVSASTEELLNPDNTLWGGAEQISLKMETPPIGNVPSNYFRAMDPTKIGIVQKVNVSSLHNGAALFFQLNWEDSKPDLNMDDPGVFRDGAAILFPFLENARMQNMGSKNEPVNAWCWQAGNEKPFNVTAAGLGTTRREDKSYCMVNPEWKDGEWRVVIARPFNVPEPDRNVALSPGIKKKFGVAVWEGSNKERAGAKSFCGNWYEVEIEA